MTHKGLQLILFLLGTLIPAVSPAEAGTPKTVRIKLATLAPNGSPWHLILQEMGQDWWEESKGGVKLNGSDNKNSQCRTQNRSLEAGFFIHHRIVHAPRLKEQDESSC